MKIANGLILAATTCIPMLANAQGGAVQVDGDDIGGVVTSADGPEAGVWVIAETGDFDTFFARIVVTDDDGRYLVPDLPRRITSSGCAATGLPIQRGCPVNVAAQ